MVMELMDVKPIDNGNGSCGNKPRLQFHEHGYKPDVKEVDQIYTQQLQQ